MAESSRVPDGLESMAFQLVLHKLTLLEQAMQTIPPLLAKIVAHLEAQTKQPEVPIASYADLYPELAAADTDEEAARETVLPLPDRLPNASPRLHGWRRWLFREDRS